MAAKTHQSGYVTGQAGGYAILQDRYIPDCAYILSEHQTTLPRDVYFVPNPPELAVEIIPHTADAAYLKHLRIKLAGYMAAGVIVWIVDAETKSVEVYHPGESSQQFDITGTLTVEDLLPGFALPVKDIFPDSPQQQ